MVPLQGIRRVIEGYSGVFGWIWRYSAHSEHLTMWQLIGMLHVQVRPSTTSYNIKGGYEELWGLSGARGVPGPAGGFFRKTSFRILPRSPRQGLCVRLILHSIGKDLRACFILHFLGKESCMLHCANRKILLGSMWLHPRLHH